MTGWLQKRPDHNPAPVTTEEERHKKFMGYAELRIERFPTAGLGLCDCKAFFKQVDSAPDGTLPWLFSSEAPQPHEIRLDEDPREVIRHCRVEGGNPQLVTNVAKMP